MTEIVKSRNASGEPLTVNTAWERNIGCRREGVGPGPGQQGQPQSDAPKVQNLAVGVGGFTLESETSPPETVGKDSTLETRTFCFFVKCK